MSTSSQSPQLRAAIPLADVPHPAVEAAQEVLGTSPRTAPREHCNAASGNLFRSALLNDVRFSNPPI